jgi:hypothetical protein
MYLGQYIADLHGTAFPANPFERELFYRDDLHNWFEFNGTVWVNLASPPIIVHDIAGPWHTSGATPGQILQANANGLPVDATNTDAQVAATVALAHLRQHDIINPLDHTSGATPGQILQANPNGLPVDATNTDAEVSAGITKLAGIEAGADVTADHDPKAHASSHESGGADALSITHDICEASLLPLILYRNLSRFIYCQFDSYDMILEDVVGTGVTTKVFFNPVVSSGATSGGAATLYQNYAWLYPYLASRPTILISAGYLTVNTVDATAFIGYALSDTTKIGINETTKHAGFILYVNGATVTIYASNADGTTQTKTDLGLSTVTTLHTFAIISDGSSSLKFYVDWDLKATHTTNIPSGAHCWKMSIVSAENGGVSLQGRSFVYSHEPTP